MRMHSAINKQHGWAHCHAFYRLMRFDKPIGTLLLLWPTLWALWIASKGIPRWDILLIFIAGVVVMRAAGCVINDIADRKFDPHVARTATRPLASGEVSLQQAIILLFALCLCALMLVLMLPPLCLPLAVIGLLLTGLYPFTKRFFPIPQAFLSLAFAWGIPMAFAAVTHHVPWTAWLLYVATGAWIIAFDTAYAMADRQDDQYLGIHSSALSWGEHECRMIAILQCVQLLLMAVLGFLAQLGWVYALGLISVSIIYYFQYVELLSRDPQRCFTVFLNNNWVGMVIFASLFMAYLL